MNRQQIINWYRTRKRRMASAAAEAVPLAVRLTNSHGQNLVLRSGQSLALGTNGSPALTTTSRYTDNTRPGAVWPWTSAVEGAGVGGIGSDNEYGGVSLVNQTRSLGPTDRHYAVRTIALSGQRIDQLDIGSTVFSNLYGASGSQLSAAYGAASGAGEPCEVAAAVFIQGEADCRDLTTLATYRDLLVAYQADVNAACQTVTGQSRDVPLFVDQVQSWTEYDVSQAPIPLAQLGAADAEPGLIFVVGPKYHLDYSIDGVHLENSGYRLMGEYQGRAMHYVLDQGVAWVPLRMDSAVATGSTIRVSMRVPAGPLAFDTSTITESWTSLQADSPTYGFELLDPNPKPAHLTGATIDGDDVVLTTSGPVHSGCSVAYARTGVPGVGAGPARAFSPKGNLRDSAGLTEVGIESGTPLHNWACTDEVSITGGVAPAAAYSSVLDDLSWDALWTAEDAPGDSGTWVDRAGSLDLTNAGGTGSATGQSTGGAGSLVIGSGNVNNAYDIGATNWESARTTVLDKPAGQDLWVRWVGYLDRSARVTLCRFQGDVGATNNWYIEARDTGALTTVMATQDANLTNSLSGGVPSTLTLSIVDVYWQGARPDGNAGSLVRICINGVSGGVSTGGSFGLVEDGVLHFGTNNAGARPLVQPCVGLGIAIGERARNQAFGAHGTVEDLNAAHYALL